VKIFSFLITYLLHVIIFSFLITSENIFFPYNDYYAWTRVPGIVA